MNMHTHFPFCLSGVCVCVKTWSNALNISYQFKLYVNKLRTKSTIYKKKRQEIAELRAETGVLSRTLEIIRLKDEQIDNKLVCNIPYICRVKTYLLFI